VPESTVRDMRDRYGTQTSGSMRWQLKPLPPLSGFALTGDEASAAFVAHFLRFHHSATQKHVTSLLAAAMEAGRLRASDMARTLAQERDISCQAARQSMDRFTTNDKFESRQVQDTLFRTLTQGSITVVIGLRFVVTTR